MKILKQIFISPLIILIFVSFLQGCAWLEEVDHEGKSNSDFMIEYIEELLDSVQRAKDAGEI